MRQELLTKAYKFLIEQGEKGVDDQDYCSYRGVNGTMCAIGCLISDEVAEEWGYRTIRGAVADPHINVPDWVEEHKLLLEDMQISHDSYNFSVNGDFKEYITACFTRIANKYRLTI